jgi:hypothetical protein
MIKKSFRFPKTNHSQDLKSRNNQSLAREVLSYTHKIWASEDTKDLNPKKFYKWVRRLAVGYSARIKDSRRLDTGRVREVHTELNNRVRTLVVLAGYRRVQCEKVCNQAKFGKKTKILRELLDPESL